ncbi:MAG TPA: ribosome maturation factor RimP [Gemmatimonadales bacterium]|nr:ribosome maturation factor RimP [Gemmatimonadales bacterium]
MTLDPLLSLVRTEVERQGFELVDFRRTGTPAKPILKVRADRPDSRPGAGITTQECAALSRSIERVLEEGGHVGPAYVLEVSSPGIERPLRFAAHWRRAVGRKAKLRARDVNGHPEVEILAVPDDDSVEVRLPGGEVRRIALADVKDATLVVDWKAVGRQKPA